MSRSALRVGLLVAALSMSPSWGWAQTFDQIMDSVQPRPPGTSYSVAIVRDGEAYFANRGGVSPDARYMLASVSKQFTAAAILALEEEGKLRLSDTVPRFLPNLTAWNQLTIKSLLNHQTTLPDYVSGQPYIGGAAFNSGVSLSNLLTIIAGAAGNPVRRPCLQYSNSNYATLAAIVEAASGKSFGAYLNEKIFAPTGMTSTSYSGGILTGVQQGHFQNGGATPNYNSSWANGAGGVVTTARDMGKWNKKLMDGFMGIVDRARDDVVTGSCMPGGVPSRYAYGWIVRLDGALEHSGSVEGYSAYNVVDPDKNVAVSVLSNFAGYAGGMPAFARALSNVAVVSGPGGAGSGGANFCCTPWGKFGPGPNPSGLAGQQCYWTTPYGVAMGQTCH